jgi:hyperosmotically inducible protein
MKALQAFALAAALAVPAGAGAAPDLTTDAGIAKEAERAILGYWRYSVFDAVGVAVQDGVVLLRGSVVDPSRSQDIEQRIKEIPGVRQVRNEIAVQSASIFDERLRWQLVRAIYGDDRLARYGLGTQPAIHIVVDRGRITLFGSVSSQVDQVLVNHIAHGVMSFGVDSRVTVVSGS